MTTAIINLLDKELPQLRGTERDELAAKIVAVLAAQPSCSTCRKRNKKRGRK